MPVPACIRSGLIGRSQAANLLAVLALLLSRGDTLDDVALARLGSVRGLPGRMERFGGGDRPLVVVDNAHAPAALEQALIEMRAHCRGRLLLVFGCGGGRDAGKRPLMGEVGGAAGGRRHRHRRQPARRRTASASWRRFSPAWRVPDDAIVERQRALAIRAALARPVATMRCWWPARAMRRSRTWANCKRPLQRPRAGGQALGEWEGRS
jgi:UDP-N-acetylmuramoyl-L-alanyl-D-glutamate--2,6-diaminopimelate ligase